jgi:hypothetical protein
VRGSGRRLGFGLRLAVDGGLGYLDRRGSLGNGRGRLGRLAPRPPRLGLLGLGLLDDRLAPKSLGVGETPHAVRGGIIDARRVALDADLQALGQIEHHLVLDAELSRQLVDPDLLGCQARCLLPSPAASLLLGCRLGSQSRT